MSETLTMEAAPPRVTSRLSPGPVQTTYQGEMAVGHPGMPATMVSWDADTYIVDKEADDPIGFARVVSLKAATEKVIELGGATAPVGVTYRDITLPAVCSGAEGYPPCFNAGVCRRGDLWVDVLGAVTAGSAVKYNATTGQLGDAAGTVMLNARWMRSAGAGGLALLRLEGPPLVVAAGP